MSKKDTYTNFTPEQARKLSQANYNWKQICQRIIDYTVPEICKSGEESARLDITDFREPVTEDDLKNIVKALESLGWTVDRVEKVNICRAHAYIRW